MLGLNLNLVIPVKVFSFKLYPTKLSVSSFCKSTPALFKLDFCIKKLLLASPNNIRSDISILLNNEVLLLVTIKRLLNKPVDQAVDKAKELAGPVSKDDAMKGLEAPKPEDEPAIGGPEKA